MTTATSYALSTDDETDCLRLIITGRPDAALIDEAFEAAVEAGSACEGQFTLVVDVSSVGRADAAAFEGIRPALEDLVAAGLARLVQVTGPATAVTVKRRLADQFQGLDCRVESITDRALGGDPTEPGRS